MVTLGRKVENPKTVKKSVEALSNMVFGLALSIGTLALISSASASPDQIISGIEGFAFSFLLIIYAWFRYTSIFEITRIEDSKMIDLNLLLLFFIVVEPYLFSLLNGSGQAMLGFTTELFAIDMAAILLTLWAIYSITIAKSAKNKNDLASYRHVRDGLFVAGIIFALSLLFTGSNRLDLWYVAFLIGIVSRHVGNIIRKR